MEACQTEEDDKWVTLDDPSDTAKKHFVREKLGGKCPQEEHTIKAGPNCKITEVKGFYKKDNEEFNVIIKESNGVKNTGLPASVVVVRIEDVRTEECYFRVFGENKKGITSIKDMPFTPKGGFRN